MMVDRFEQASNHTSFLTTTKYCDDASYTDEEEYKISRKLKKPTTTITLHKQSKRTQCSWTDEEKQKYFRLAKKKGYNLKGFYRHFPQKSQQQVNNFWMNHKYRGMCLQTICERRDRMRLKHLVDYRLVFKGKTLSIQTKWTRGKDTCQKARE